MRAPARDRRSRRRCCPSRSGFAADQRHARRRLQIESVSRKRLSALSISPMTEDAECRGLRVRAAEFGSAPCARPPRIPPPPRRRRQRPRTSARIRSSPGQSETYRCREKMAEAAEARRSIYSPRDSRLLSHMSPSGPCRPRDRAGGANRFEECGLGGLEGAHSAM